MNHPYYYYYYYYYYCYYFLLKLKNVQLVRFIVKDYFTCESKWNDLNDQSSLACNKLFF